MKRGCFTLLFQKNTSDVPSCRTLLTLKAFFFSEYVSEVETLHSDKCFLHLLFSTEIRHESIQSAYKGAHYLYTKDVTLHMPL